MEKGGPESRYSDDGPGGSHRENAREASLAAPNEGLLKFPTDHALRAHQSVYDMHQLLPSALRGKTVSVSYQTGIAWVERA